MTSIRWLVLALTLSFALPANAQFRKAHLTEQGQLVVEATAADVSACEVVYRWDRCPTHSDATASPSSRSERRRQNCIASSRNVAAKKGAGHYVVDGPVFTGYRCPRSTEAAPGQAAVPPPASPPVDVARYKALGFTAWGGVCTQIDELFDAACDDRVVASERDRCRERRAAALRRGERVYYRPSVDHRIEHDSKARSYAIEFKGVLERLGASGDQRYLTAGPLVVPRRGTTTAALADAARPFERLVVPEGELQAPERFEGELLIEALVRPKALHAPVRRNPAQISALEVEVVGLRAYVPDLSWGAVIIRPPAGISAYQCTPLDPPKGP